MAYVRYIFVINKYDKIVRDNIPNIIIAQGGSCKTKVVGNFQAVEYLINKVEEEITEFRESRNIEELADILEVIFFITIKLGISMDDIESIRCKKFQERGGFGSNIILLESEGCQQKPKRKEH